MYLGSERPIGEHAAPGLIAGAQLMPAFIIASRRTRAKPTELKL